MLFKVGILLLLLPIGFLLLFAVGETASGDLSGLFHLVPVILLLTLGWLARKKAAIVGIGLIVTSLLMGISYPLCTAQKIETVFLIELLLFGPLFISGIIYVRQAQQTHPNHRIHKNNASSP